MSAYNFKSQFVHAVQLGSKRTTIRQNRKRNPRVGEALQLYTGMRQKGCHKIIPDVICNAVAPVIIHRGKFYLCDVRIIGFALEELAKRDGFETSREFLGFFKRQYGDHFEGLLISW